MLESLSPLIEIVFTICYIESVPGQRPLSVAPMALGASASLLFLGLASACTSSHASLVGPSVEKCQSTVSSAPTSFNATGGSGVITIATARECVWSLNIEASWISTSADREGQGDAVVPYSVQANPVPVPRMAALTVAGHRLQLSQSAAACHFELSHSATSVIAAGGTVSVEIRTLSGCSWHVDTPDPWIAITSARSGTTSGTVTMSVEANTGAGRVGTVTLSERTFTITQEAAANPTLTPATHTHADSVTATGANACADPDTCPDAASAGADSDTPTSADGEVFREGGKTQWYMPDGIVGCRRPNRHNDEYHELFSRKMQRSFQR